MVAIAPISLIRVRELTASIDPHKSINPNTTTNNLLGKTQELGHGLLHTSPKQIELHGGRSGKWGKEQRQERANDDARQGVWSVIYKLTRSPLTFWS